SPYVPKDRSSVSQNPHQKLLLSKRNYAQSFAFQIHVNRFAVYPFWHLLRKYMIVTCDRDQFSFHRLAKDPGAGIPLDPSQSPAPQRRITVDSAIGDDLGTGIDWR